MGGHGHGRAGSAGLACLHGEVAVVLMWLAGGVAGADLAELDGLVGDDFGEHK